jgi:hypothetical protein
MNKAFRSFWTFILTFIAFSYPQSTSDFLITPRPSIYTILNQYQQAVGADEQKEFVPYSPFQVANQDEVLGDQITKALRFSFNNKVYFLQKDDTGRLIGERDKNDHELLKKCTLMEDTVEVLKDKAVPFFGRNMPAGLSAYLRKGESVVRIFKYNDRFYVKRNEKTAVYGWVPGYVQNAFRRSIAAPAASADMSGYMHDRIIERFASANAIYRRYFDHFNSLTDRQKAVPVWRCETKGNEIQCLLNSPYQTGDQLRESTQYIVRDIENMLLGKPFLVLSEQGSITIRPK